MYSYIAIPSHSLLEENCLDTSILDFFILQNLISEREFTPYIFVLASVGVQETTSCRDVQFLLLIDGDYRLKRPIHETCSWLLRSKAKQKRRLQNIGLYAFNFIMVFSILPKDFNKCKMHCSAITEG